MNREPRHPSELSREELLQELYRLRHQLTERAQAVAALRAELDWVLRSRSWRLTAPLRALVRSGGWGWRRARRIGLALIGAPRALRASLAGGARAVARALGMQVPQAHTRLARLWVDVSELAQRDNRTGVQRVVREIARALLHAPPTGYVVELVAARPGERWRTRRRFAASLSGGSAAATPEQAMRARTGDVFLGLDHSLHSVAVRVGEFERMRANGVRSWFICHDTLPLDRPDWFPPDAHLTFKHWFETIARVGAGIACVSRATQADVERWIDRLDLRREPPIVVGQFRNGADLPQSDSVTPLTPSELEEVERLQRTRSVLMVGTLEPRKGHAQALAAFELLWQRGNDVSLVIVGKGGWMTEALQQRIREHAEFGQRLLWFRGASDAMLQALYQTCNGLLAPSEGEGFGLPLVEAARYGLPILCRDLAVFREVMADAATYFSGFRSEDLAQATQAWLAALARGTAPQADGFHWCDWAESAQGLLGVMLGEHPRGWLAHANQARPYTSSSRTISSSPR